MYEQDIHIHHSLLQLCSIKAVCQLRRVSSCSPALESKLSIAKTSDRVPNVALMLLRKRMQSSHRCSVVTASVPLTRAKLRVLQTRQRKPSLLNQKQRLCRNWAQQKARAAPMNRLPPGCVTKQETGSYNTRLSRPLRWIVSLLLADATESKDRKQLATERRSKLYLLVFWSYHMPVAVARRKLVKFFFFFLNQANHLFDKYTHICTE